jgi:hypothetical protein
MLPTDLHGQQGHNAFYLLRLVRVLADKLGLDGLAIRREMMVGDYQHLVATFDKYFGGHVIRLDR